MALVPPLDGPLAVTSSFCEYRANRLHGGVDFSTRGEVGLPVRAVAAGTLARVKIAPDGYGRALYLRLDDGRTAVYGHLHRLSPPLARSVHERQLEARSYRLDWHPSGPPIRFQAGEIVAWSGRAATPVAHLHFEIRDSANRPLDPLGEGIASADSVPPRVEAIRVVPRGARSLVEGSPFPLDLVPVLGKATARLRRYRSAAALRIEGRASLEVDVHDADDAGRGRLAIAGGRLLEQDRPLLELALSRFSWGAASRSRHLYSGLSEEPGARSRIRLDVPLDGADEHLRAADPERPRGWIDAAGLGAGEGEITLELWDRAGNRALVSLALVAGVPEDRPAPVRAELRVEPVDGRLALALAAPRSAAAEPLAEIVAAGREPVGIELRAAGPGRWVGWHRPRGPGSLRVGLGDRTWQRPLPYHPLAPGAAARLEAPPAGAQLAVPQGGVYQDALVSIQVPPRIPAPAAGRGLQRVGPALEIGPRSLVFREPSTLTIPWSGDQAPAAVQLYSLERGAAEQRWRRIESKASAAFAIGTLTRPGLYAPFADSLAPEVSGAAWIAKGPGPGGSLRLPLADAGAGLDLDSIELLVDGAWLPAAVDGPRDRVEARLAAPLAPGAHSLLLRAADRAGNRLEHRSSIEISNPAAR